MIRVSPKLIKGLAALGLGVIGARSQGTESSCVETVTARTGDTCASLAEFAGISVSQFLRSNPLVQSCDILVGGAVYCIAGTAASETPTPAGLPSFPSSLPSTQGSFVISRDGACGGNVTCAGSRFGRCCSAHGFCGTSVDYCGEGCQVGLGQCGDDVSPEATSAIISVVTVVATSTVRVTDTVRVTTTLVTVTTPVASTTPAKISTTATTRTIQTPVSTGKPSPTLPRTPNNCKTYDKILPDDSCSTIATRNNLNLRDFYRLNPVINTAPSFPAPPFPGPFPGPGGIGGPGTCSPSRPVSDPLGLLCRVNCEDLWEGYYVCTSEAAGRGWGFGPW